MPPPYMIAVPHPTVVTRPADWEPIEPGLEQKQTPYGHFEWSPDRAWWEDTRVVDNIRYQCRPPLRPW